MQTRVSEAYQSFLKKLLPLFPFSINPSLLDTPIQITTIYGDLNPQFIDFMAPGIMVTIIFTLAIGLTALIFVIEKNEGILERTAVAGVNTIELITAHMSAKFIIMILQTVVLLGISIFLFGVNMKGSFFIAGLLLILQGFAGMSFGKNKYI